MSVPEHSNEAALHLTSHQPHASTFLTIAGMEDRATHPVLTLPIPHLQVLQRGTTGAKPPCFGVGDKDSLIGERKASQSRQTDYSFRSVVL